MNIPYLITTCEALNAYKKAKNPQEREKKLKEFHAIFKVGEKRGFYDFTSYLIIMMEINSEDLEEIKKLTKKDI